MFLKERNFAELKTMFSLKIKLCILISFIIYSDFVLTVCGTGTMYDPAQRGVQWKYQFPTKRNYNYMQLNCGGILVSIDMELKIAK